MKCIIYLLICIGCCLCVFTVRAQQPGSSTASVKGEQDLNLSAEDQRQLQKEAVITAAYLTKKYEGDAVMEKALAKFYYSRQMDLKKTWATFNGSDQLNQELTKIIQRYDSAETKILFVAKGNVFLKKQLMALNAIKVLPQKDMHTLQNLFLKACSENTDKSYADYFNEVMHFVIKDTAYYAVWYKDEILHQTHYNANRAVYDLVHKNQITKEAMKEIGPLVYDKEWCLSVINYAFPAFTKYKDSIYVNAINYYDSLISLALKRDGTFARTSKFSTAVKNRFALQLRPGQTDTLLERAYTLEKMQNEFSWKNPLGKFDAAPFEAEFIPQILSEDQYLKLLAVINKPQADKWAYDDWEELVKRGMANDLDSARIIREFTQYNIARLVAKDRYADDKIKQNAQINAIDSNMPPALRRLKTARRKPDTAANNIVSPAPGAIHW